MKKNHRNYLIEVDNALCDYCGVCVGVCPENCIDLQAYHLEVDESQCTRCSYCIVVCPVAALSRKEYVTES